MLLVVCLALAPWVAQAEAFDLPRLMGLLARTPHANAHFQEEKRLALLTEPLASSGILQFQPPSHLVKRRLLPTEEVVRLDGDTLTIARPAENYSRSMSLDNQPELRGLVEAVRGTLAGDLEGLRQFFDLGLEGDADGWVLSLTPRSSQLRRMLALVKVTGRGGDLDKVETREADGDISVMLVQPDRS